MGLLEFQARNVDKLMVGKIIDTASYYAPSADRYLIKGAKEVNVKIEIDSDENKAEGEVQALYGKILKASGSVKLGKISLDGHALLLNAKRISSTGVEWLHIVRNRYLPYCFFDCQSLWDQDNGSADNRVVAYKIMLSSYEYTVGQDNMAEVSFDWHGIFTENPVIRSDAETLSCAAIGRNATAATTLGDTIETTAAA